MSARTAALVSVLFVACAASACRNTNPLPEVTCAEQCEKVASKRCSPKECARGCAFVLDRLVEHEGAAVLACVSGGTGPCGDATWADCAARVPYPDGGPAGPPPVDDNIDEPDDKSKKKKNGDDDE